MVAWINVSETLNGVIDVSGRFYALSGLFKTWFGLLLSAYGHVIGGPDIWQTSDQFSFLTNSLNGEGAIITRVFSQAATDPWAQASIMIRNDIADNTRGRR